MNWNPYRRRYNDDDDDGMEDRVRYVEEYEEKRGRRRRRRRRRSKGNDLEFRRTRNGQPVSRVLSRVTHFQRILAVINIQRLYRGYRARKWYRTVSRPERCTPPRKSSRMSFETTICTHCRLLESDRYCIDCKGSLCDSCFVLIHPRRTKHRWHPNGSRVVIVGRSPSPSPRRRRVSPKGNRRDRKREPFPRQDSPVRESYTKHSQRKKFMRYQRHDRDEYPSSSARNNNSYDDDERRYSEDRRVVAAERRSPSSRKEERRYRDERRHSPPRVSSRDVSAVIQVKKIVKNNTKTLQQQQEEQQQLWKQPRKRRDSDADSTSSSECTMATG